MLVQCVHYMDFESRSDINQVFSVAALLSHQMEQRLNLERTLRDEREKLNTMRVDVRELEHKVNQKMLVRLGPLNMRQGDVVRRLRKKTI